MDEGTDRTNRSEFDADATAEIVRLLADVDDFWRRREAVLWRPSAPGSVAVADAALPDARFVSIYAGQALGSAVDHLHAWRLLVRGGEIPYLAHVTLLRGALEGAVRCRWLVDARVECGVRVGRGYAARRDDQEERRKWETSVAAIGGSTSSHSPAALSAAERLARLDDPEAVRKRQEAGVRSVGFTNTTALMKIYRLEPWYRLASGGAHAKEWALGAADLRQAPDRPSTPAVRHGIVSASATVALELTRVAVQAVRSATEELEAYLSKAVAG
jgi:hypothetical protein